MNSVEKQILPDRDSFANDPFGYSALAWHKWGMARTLAGFPIDLSKPPTSEDLKFPLLWLTHAHAMAEAGKTVIQSEPTFENMPDIVKGVCDCQYCAVALMLVGYSLEICLKAMLILQKGIDGYTSEERKHRHHKLDELSKFIPGLSPKDIATLKILTHFVYWAGRYPDPGSGRADNAEEIFTISEKHKISAKDLFILSARIMKYTQEVVDVSIQN